MTNPSNPVDDNTFTRPLIRALRQHVEVFAASMAGAKASSGRLAEVRPAAVAWVYCTVLVAWAEDHHLIDPFLRTITPELRREVLDRAGGPRGWVAAAINRLAAAHPATRCLLDGRYSALHDHTPTDDACLDLIHWWADEAPPLAYEATSGPLSISGWLAGDILQHLRDPRPHGGGGGNAQTPWWIADGILDLTLLPAAAEFTGQTLHTVDPTCGTGHFLVRMIDFLWEWYTTGGLAARQMKVKGITGGPVYPPAEAIRRILAGVHGCEIDPLTASVARLRCVVTIGELMHRSSLIPVLRLDRIPPIRPRIAVGDSLLAGRISRQEHARLHPGLAAIANLGHDHEPAPPVVVVTAPQQPDLFGAAS
ncbi:hypothetical protein DQ384_26155 [Sphaerisporangium album]|uniref:site-specific DNA-methyltransferase (adenine-specific) n=1 Tax=Sphaerisporangium album TaxID=509200 RepID=A0A367FBZ2_9ACTN|nr:hypothetical protein [Sphaerisporangium album]RCG27205.1 hypothetical protein DQ384_26155 [Sphaerisporangium album]